MEQRGKISKREFSYKAPFFIGNKLSRHFKSVLICLLSVQICVCRFYTDKHRFFTDLHRLNEFLFQ